MIRTKEQVRKAIFGKLARLRRKLLARGVPCNYARSRLFHENGNGGFTITYHGESTLVPHISIRTADSTEEFRAETFDLGLARLKALFHTEADLNGKARE